MPLTEHRPLDRLITVTARGASAILTAVGMNRELAAQLADERLDEWRRLGFKQWRRMLNHKELRQVTGKDGTRYNVASYALDDGDGRVRMVVAVDDGGWSAFAPLCAGTKSCARTDPCSTECPIHDARPPKAHSSPADRALRRRGGLGAVAFLIGLRTSRRGRNDSLGA